MPTPESPNVLVGGAWVNDHGIMRWIDGAIPADPTPEKYPYESLIACPTCHAMAWQTCRTQSGHTTTSHGSRLIGRVCRCGIDLAAKRRYCDFCRTEVDRENKLESQRRIRAERSAA